MNKENFLGIFQLGLAGGDAQLENLTANVSMARPFLSPSSYNQRNCSFTRTGSVDRVQ
jgi:hypothetical protein